MDDHFGTGAIDRPEDFLKPKAWRHEEIAAAFAPAVWKEKNPEGGFITYPKRNQTTQFSCVAYTLSKQLAVDELSENGVYRELSPRSVYPYVFVSPDGGANSLSATKLVSKQGMTLESLLKTDFLSEMEVRSDKGYATDAKQIAFVYKPEGFIECAVDFETIASILDGYQKQGLKKIVAITIVGENNGTWHSAMPKPPGRFSLRSKWYHRVAVTDFGLINKKKFLSIDNSWGTSVGINGQQFLSEDYVPHMYGGIYTLNAPDNWQQLSPSTVTPPKYTWAKDLSVGSSGPDVTALQTALQSMGMFPISSVLKPTGSYFGITRKAVELFQSTFALPVTGSVDALTRAKLNEIFK